MKTATEEQVRARFCVPDTKEAMKTLREMQDETWTQEMALDMLKDILKKLQEDASKEGENIKDWDFLELATWVIKEAFVSGFLSGCMICFESNERGVQEIFGD